MTVSALVLLFSPRPVLPVLSRLLLRDTARRTGGDERKTGRTPGDENTGRNRSRLELNCLATGWTAVRHTPI